MVLADNLHQAGLVLRKQGEILDQVEQARPVARSPDHLLQRHPPWLILALDALPLEEPTPVRRQRANAAVRAIGADDESVVGEERRNPVLGMLVAGDVVIERRARRHARLLQLDDHQRQAIDETDQIRPAGVERAGHAELADQQEVICIGAFPINRFHTNRGLPCAPMQTLTPGPLSQR